MPKGQSDNHQDQQGTPTYIILSVLLALVLFGIGGFKDSVALNASDGSERMINLAFIGLGLALCFSWRRLHDSTIKKLSAAVFATSLWVYLSLAAVAPLLGQNSPFELQASMLQQIGFGGLIASGLCLVLAFLTHQKMAPTLMLTNIFGFGVGIVSVLPLVQVANNFERRSLPQSAEKASGQNPKILAEDEDGAELHSHSSPQQDHGKMKMTAKHLESIDQEHHPTKPIEGEEADNEHREETTTTSKIHEPDHEDSTVLPNPKVLTKAEKKRLEHNAPVKPIKKLATAHTEVKFHARSFTKIDKHSLPHWEYSGDHGPQAWGDIDESFKTCATGIEQSPINIPSNWASKENIQLFYKPSTYQIIDNGHTVQINVERGNFAMIGQQNYELKQFHFHTPSEHLLNSRNAPMELHFVHANEKGNLAVIGVLIEVGSLNLELKKIWDYFPHTVNELVKPVNLTLNPRSLLPFDLRAFNYAGSLTTPPCSEQVNWNVMQASIRMSQEQIDRFREKYRMNARIQQPLNYRGNR
ncbi:MAG: carbonic anhydrase family protein [Proteobacteria bacterium]|nr:carbonic anhydrase family protein [Pseudomonadota bacterium]